MSLSSNPQELPAVGFLTDVGPTHREFLASFGEFIRPKNGEMLIFEGAVQKCLYFILSGTLHVVTTASGRTILIATLKAGDSLGEVNIFDPARASASVLARSECLIWRITDDELKAFFAADAEGGIELMQVLLRVAAKRIRAMNVKLVDSEEKASFHDFWKADE